MERIHWKNILQPKTGFGMISLNTLTSIEIWLFITFQRTFTNGNWNLCFAIWSIHIDFAIHLSASYKTVWMNRGSTVVLTLVCLTVLRLLWEGCGSDEGKGSVKVISRWYKNVHGLHAHDMAKGEKVGYAGNYIFFLIPIFLLLIFLLRLLAFTKSFSFSFLLLRSSFWGESGIEFLLFGKYLRRVWHKNILLWWEHPVWLKIQYCVVV